MVTENIPILLSPPEVGSLERQYLLDALDSNWIAPLGPHVSEFEKELAAFVGVKHAISLSSGTAALHLALLVAGVKPGDIVFASTFTFAATVNAITYVGARPVLVDSNQEDWCIDADLLEEELRRRRISGNLPKALIAVDLYGLCADYRVIKRLCQEYGVVLIEDAAEALGSKRYSQNAGTFGDLAVFSFNGNKIITTSGGGALVSDNIFWIDRARYLSNQARAATVYYHHEEVGYNYRMSNLLAALGRGQLAKIDGKISARRQINKAYREKFKKINFIQVKEEPEDTISNCWLTCVTLDADGKDIFQLQKFLESKKIESRPLWKPMHLQPVFQACEKVGGQVSETLFQKGLCLPSGSQMTNTDLERVTSAILEYFT